MNLIAILLYCTIFNIKFYHSFLTKKHILRNNYISDIQLPRKSLNGLIDLDQNGKIDIIEVTNAVLSHSSLLKHFNNNFKIFIKSIFDVNLMKAIFLEVKSIMSPFDILIITCLLSTYKTLLRFIYDKTHPNKQLTYEKSFIGSLEQPITYVLWFPPILLLVDIFSLISLHILKSMNKQMKYKNLPKLVYLIYTSITFGSFTTKLKDWILYKKSLAQFNNKLLNKALSIRKDEEKDKITNEISSILIWIVILLFCLEAMSLELGIALGSLFTLGGISSASFVLALKSTMENIVGGVLLKLQDKFRVGESIGIGGSSSGGNDVGEVESMHYLATKVRLSDDSVISIPNQNFIQKEVVNWSRTPYRLFKTSITIKISDILILPTLINTLREELSLLAGVETKARDLIISAKGFDDDEIIIEIDAKLKASNDLELSNIRTIVINKIAYVLEKNQKML